MMIIDILYDCIENGQNIDIDFEFSGSLHMYESVTIKGLTEDGYVVMHVPYLSEEGSLMTIEVFACVEHIVKISRIVAKIDDTKLVHGNGSEDSE